MSERFRDYREIRARHPAHPAGRLLSIIDATSYARARGVAAKVFWTEAAGGDMTPILLSTAADICGRILEAYQDRTMGGD